LTILTRYFRVFQEWGVFFDGFILVIIMLIFPEGLFVGAARKLAGIVSRRRSTGFPGRASRQTADGA